MSEDFFRSDDVDDEAPLDEDGNPVQFDDHGNIVETKKSNTKRWKCRGCDFERLDSCSCEWCLRHHGPCHKCRIYFDVVYPKRGMQQGGIKALNQIKKKKIKRVSTGMPDLDKLLGGNEVEGFGAVRGTTVFFAGESGSGKTTLLMQIIAHICKTTKRKAVYASSEQSEAAINHVAGRVGVDSDMIMIMGNEPDVEKILDICDELKPIVLVIDSISMALLNDAKGKVDTAEQTGGIAKYCSTFSSANDIIIFLVGHHVKDGSVAGPQVIVHAVDQFLDMWKEPVLDDEGNEHPEAKGVRKMIIGKNRYGQEDQEMFLQMLEDGSGIRALSDRVKKIMNPPSKKAQEIMAKVVDISPAGRKRKPRGYSEDD